MADKKESKSIKENSGLDIEKMAEAGIHIGHKTSRVYPKMKPYIFGVRNGIHIIDLEKTQEKFLEALKFIKDIIVNNKLLILVGTKIQIKDLVKDTAKECGLPYVNERWLGGTLTNFTTIKKRMDFFKDLEKKKEKKELEKYTKKERLKIDKELRDLEVRLGGIKNLEKLPDAIFIIDLKKEITAVREAKKLGIPVIGVVDTDTDPALADYLIPANDDAISSVKYILEKIKEVVLKAKTNATPIHLSASATPKALQTGE